MINKHRRPTHILSHVGNDPIAGGGVARFARILIALFEDTNTPKTFVDLSKLDVGSTILLLLCRLASRDTIVLNSFWHSISLILLNFSRASNIIVATNGEFTSGAFATRTKFTWHLKLRIVRIMSSISFSFKRTRILVNSDEEMKNVHTIFPTANVAKVPLLFEFAETKRIDRSALKASDRIMVLVGRMVPNKGFSRFLSEITKESASELDAVWLFYTKSNNQYLAAVREEIARVEQLGIQVSEFVDKNDEEIFEACRDLNVKLVVPSDFESFCYVLLENLWMPNKPIVTFENDFVGLLKTHDMVEYRSSGLATKLNFCGDQKPYEEVLTVLNELQKTNQAANQEAFMMSTN